MIIAGPQPYVNLCQSFYERLADCGAELSVRGDINILALISCTSMHVTMAQSCLYDGSVMLVLYDGSVMLPRRLSHACTSTWGNFPELWVKKRLGNVSQSRR